MTDEAEWEYIFAIVSPIKVVRPYTSLKAWRESQGLDQRAAAKALGITQGYYSRLERGTAAPRPETARTMMDICGVPLEVLMGIAS